MYCVLYLSAEHFATRLPFCFSDKMIPTSAEAKSEFQKRLFTELLNRPSNSMQLFI